MTKKTSSKIKKLFFYGLTVGLSLFVLLFVITCVWIGYEVKDRCRQAQQDYGNSTCSQALASLLQDDTRSFASRNSAVWTLGQLGNPKSLPVLESFYTDNIPAREPINGTLSQYELKKAINLTSGGTNITSIFWRYGIE